MKQTAVEYLLIEFSEILGKIKIQPMESLLLVDAIKEAKKMEKQQIIDAYETSHISMMTSKQYYNETFENK